MRHKTTILTISISFIASTLSSGAMATTGVSSLKFFDVFIYLGIFLLLLLGFIITYHFYKETENKWLWLITPTIGLMAYLYVRFF